MLARRDLITLEAQFMASLLIVYRLGRHGWILGEWWHNSGLERLGRTHLGIFRCWTWTVDSRDSITAGPGTLVEEDLGWGPTWFMGPVGGFLGEGQHPWWRSLVRAAHGRMLQGGLWKGDVLVSLLETLVFGLGRLVPTVWSSCREICPAIYSSSKFCGRHPRRDFLTLLTTSLLCDTLFLKCWN